MFVAVFLKFIEINFGLKQKGYNANVDGRSHNYTYNNTELEQSLGLDWYEMPLRSYDPTIARWNRIDPITHLTISTYNAFGNNPVYYNDPSGGSHHEIREGRMVNRRDYANDGNARGYSNTSGISRDGNSITIDWDAIPTDGGATWLNTGFGGIGFTFTRRQFFRAAGLRRQSTVSAGDGVMESGDCCGEAGAERMIRQRMADRLAAQHGGNASDWYDTLMAEDAEAGMRAGTEGLLMVTGEAAFSWALKGIRGAWVAWIARGANTAASSTKFLKLLRPIDEFDEALTLYRGTTGSEAGSSSIFLTDNAAVAATYIKNGGQVVSYRISQFALKHLEQSGALNLLRGIHNRTGQISTEYQFIGRELVGAINQLAK